MLSDAAAIHDYAMPVTRLIAAHAAMMLLYGFAVAAAAMPYASSYDYALRHALP